MGATWFKHDADASRDIKMRKLLRKGGAEAYGRYWSLMEAMASQGGTIVALNEDDWSVVAEYCLFDIDQVAEAKDFVGLLAQVGLLSTVALGCGKLVSERMLKQVEKFERTSRARSEAGRKGGQKSPSKSE